MNNFSLKRDPNGVWFGTFAHFDHLKLRHGISTRLGGLSQSPYATLNLGMKTDDNPETVKINRSLFCQAVGVPAARLISAQQIHGTQIHIVESQDASKGVDSFEPTIPNTDALITAEAEIPLMLLFADCVPVLIFDPVRKVVAVSHAGWKGTVGKIAQKTLLTMQENFASRPESCFVAIGPSIGPCCYEVDEPVIHAFRDAFPWWRDLVISRGEKRWMLDLWQANRRQLAEIGVQNRNIEISGICTNCNTELFYSHRGENGITGRMGAVIML